MSLFARIAPPSLGLLLRTRAAASAGVTLDLSAKRCYNWDRSTFDDTPPNRFVNSGTEKIEVPATADELDEDFSEEKRGNFRVLDIGLRPPKPPKEWVKSRVSRRKPREGEKVHREKKMSPDQNWESVWPSIRTFHPSVVPLPIRQGYVKDRKKDVIPSKFANVELMKVPNFLHLTPPVVARQCQAIKKFCTKWPLAADAPTPKSLPGECTSSTYLNASSSIRDYRSRVVTLRYPLESFKLSPAAEEKFVRLAGSRYEPPPLPGEEDIGSKVSGGHVSITSDVCPYRKQNRDYVEYLFTALYFESQKRETWEDTDWTEADSFEFGGRFELIGSGRVATNAALAELLNKGENPSAIDKYKRAVLQELVQP